MGIYLNSITAYALYKNESRKPYFVDKTLLLSELSKLVYQGSNYICITRPRRFGKTITANMISSFFSKGCDSTEVFEHLRIAQTQEYQANHNRHNVIHINFSKMDDTCRDYETYIDTIKHTLLDDIRSAYPEVSCREETSIPEYLERVHAQTGEQFIFILDEWDTVFHEDFVKEADKKKYLLFLKSLLKDQPYVSLAYMTGILPIAKYSSGSELNMFLEYTMASEEKYSEYFGFTEQEVDELYERYLTNTKQPQITRKGLRDWYNGYHTKAGVRVYNPRSVVASLTNNNLGNYWTSAGPYDEIFTYVEKNVDEVRDDLAKMISGIPVRAKVREYAATSMRLTTRSEIFSAMVVYGFLSSDNGYVSIPNKELMDKFADMLQKEPSLDYVYRLAKNSMKMLEATLAGDTDTMEELLSYTHDTEIPLLRYNSEESLSAVVNLSYLAARDIYLIKREEKAGVGFVDFIFYPQDKRGDGMILELKVNHTPEEAIQQIKEKKYAMNFTKGPEGKRQYSGRVLAVGIAYDTQTKKHRCKVEVLEKL